MQNILSSIITNSVRTTGRYRSAARPVVSNYLTNFEDINKEYISQLLSPLRSSSRYDGILPYVGEYFLTHLLREHFAAMFKAGAGVHFARGSELGALLESEESFVKVHADPEFPFFVADFETPYSQFEATLTSIEDRFEMLHGFKFLPSFSCSALHKHLSAIKDMDYSTYCASTADVYASASIDFHDTTLKSVVKGAQSKRVSKETEAFKKIVSALTDWCALYPANGLIDVVSILRFVSSLSHHDKPGYADPSVGLTIGNDFSVSTIDLPILPLFDMSKQDQPLSGPDSTNVLTLRVDFDSGLSCAEATANGAKLATSLTTDHYIRFLLIAIARQLAKVSSVELLDHLSIPLSGHSFYNELRAVSKEAIKGDGVLKLALANVGWKSTFHEMMERMISSPKTSDTVYEIDFQLQKALRNDAISFADSVLQHFNSSAKVDLYACFTNHISRKFGKHRSFLLTSSVNQVPKLSSDYYQIERLGNFRIHWDQPVTWLRNVPDGLPPFSDEFVVARDAMLSNRIVDSVNIKEVDKYLEGSYSNLELSSSDYTFDPSIEHLALLAKTGFRNGTIPNAGIIEGVSNIELSRVSRDLGFPITRDVQLIIRSPMQTGDFRASKYAPPLTLNTLDITGRYDGMRLGRVTGQFSSNEYRSSMHDGIVKVIDALLGTYTYDLWPHDQGESTHMSVQRSNVRYVKRLAKFSNHFKVIPSDDISKIAQTVYCFEDVSGALQNVNRQAVFEFIKKLPNYTLLVQEDVLRHLARACVSRVLLMWEAGSFSSSSVDLVKGVLSGSTALESLQTRGLANTIMVRSVIAQLSELLLAGSNVDMMAAVHFSVMSRAINVVLDRQADQGQFSLLSEETIEGLVTKVMDGIVS